jgi:hypothetical protein
LTPIYRDARQSDARYRRDNRAWIQSAKAKHDEIAAAKRG